MVKVAGSEAPEGAPSGAGTGRHRGRPDRSSGWLGIVVLATVAALSLAGVIVWAAVLDQQDSAGLRASTGQSPKLPSPPGNSVDQTPPGQPPAAGTDGVAACAGEVAAADAEVAAARVGIGHWAEHIRARTDLLSGAEPKAVTKAIWKRTREAGPTDLARYQQAVAELARRSGACAPAAGNASAGAADPAGLAACRQRLRVLAPAVAAGAASMGDWKAHQEAMAAHKAGEIDAAHAQHLWVAAWTAAPKNINAFRAADAALPTAPTCHP